jgi:hypothetical protein
MEDGRRITKSTWPSKGNPLKHAKDFVLACRVNMCGEDPEVTIEVPRPDGSSKWFRDRIADQMWLTMTRPSKANESLLRTISTAARSVAPHIDNAAMESEVEKLEQEEEDIERRDMISAEPQATNTATTETPEPGTPIN